MFFRFALRNFEAILGDLRGQSKGSAEEFLLRVDGQLVVMLMRVRGGKIFTLQFLQWQREVRASSADFKSSSYLTARQ